MSYLDMKYSDRCALAIGSIDPAELGNFRLAVEIGEKRNNSSMYSRKPSLKSKDHYSINLPIAMQHFTSTVIPTNRSKNGYQT